jgi:hypothetical protein
LNYFRNFFPENKSKTEKNTPKTTIMKKHGFEEKSGKKSKIEAAKQLQKTLYKNESNNFVRF